MMRSVFPVLALVSAAAYQESNAPTNTKDKDHAAHPAEPAQLAPADDARRVKSEAKRRLIWENW